MRMIFTICIFLVIGNSTFGQPYRTEFIEFHDYQTVLNDLKQYGNKSKYFETLDYESMLFLDKTSLNSLRKIKHDFLVERNIDTLNIFFEVPVEHVKELNTNYLNIKELFNKNNWKNIIKQLGQENLDDNSDMKLDKDIYTKDDLKAVFTIRKPNWSISYRVSLKNKKIRFEELYQTQE
jgi:hypothetical protein